MKLVLRILSCFALCFGMADVLHAQPCSPPQTRVWIHAADNGTGSDTLWFGFDSTASCGVDAHLCELEFWWPCGDPPLRVFCAFWYPWCNPGSAPLIRHDYRNLYSAAQRDTFRLGTQVGDGATNMVLSWPAGLGSLFASLEMRHFNGTQWVVTNMLTDTSADMTNSLVNQHIATIYSRTLLVSVGETSASMPERFALSQNYPNPFNPSTTIRFEVPASGFVSLKVYNLLGQEVATVVNETKQAGTYEVVWDASGQASGVYFYRLRSGEFAATRKLVIIR
jgi:hypothetical protein